MRPPRQKTIHITLEDNLVNPSPMLMQRYTEHIYMQLLTQNAGAAQDFPKLAILQLRDDNANRGRRFVGLAELLQVDKQPPNVNNYEIIYIEKAAVPVDTNGYFLESLYSRFNGVQPCTYYGHSLSISDVIVVATSASSMNTYYVDNFGFTSMLDFLEPNTKSKIALGVDVRTEYEICKALNEKPIKSDSEQALQAYCQKRERLLDMYKMPFQMADRRRDTVSSRLEGATQKSSAGCRSSGELLPNKDTENVR